MKKAGVIYRDGAVAPELAERAAALLGELGLEVRSLESQPVRPGTEVVSEAEFSTGLELVVVIGGDGTLLRATQLVEGADPLVLGVKLGGLGFLTEIQPEELEAALRMAVEGQARWVERMMLGGEIIGPKRKQPLRALNDITITVSGPPRLIELDAFVDDVFVSSFRADGLVVATPTGSTAYNLAAGGPIIHPEMHCLIITPIAPHTLTSRPLVIPASSRISVLLANSDKAVAVSADAQRLWPLTPGEKVEIQAARHGLKLMCSPSLTYYEILRTKLRWGER